MAQGGLQWEFTEQPKADDLAVVDAGLHVHNLAAADLEAVKPLACFARTAAGEVVGGLRARQWGAAVEVQQLWVDEQHRRRGIGARLMAMLEEAAVERGARLIYLDTFSFQAPQFYRRCGFTEAARLDGFPDGIGKYLMVKHVGGQGGG
jgi:ribosomal protein S18 acetylase RimI-like enzyme